MAASTTTAADPAPDASAPEGDGTWVVDRKRVRRPLGGLFWLAALVVPLGLTACVALTRTPALEQSLRGEAVQALSKAGLAHVHVVVDGRQLVAQIPTGTDAVKVTTTLQSVPGVEGVSTVDVYASKAEARACANLQAKVDRATHREDIPFVGGSTHLSAAGVGMLHSVAQLLRACRPATVIVGGHTDSHTVNGSTVSLIRARVMVHALHAQGIATRRMTSRGYGDVFPLTSGSAPAAQARNQRGSIAVEEH